MRIVQLESVEQLAELTAGGEMGPVSAAELTMHRPDRHLIAVAGDRTLVGRCSLWWSQVPPYENHRLGYIGHYAVANDRAATLLLAEACRELAGSGCTMAVGPLDGTTWRRYRFIVDRGDEPPFFLEPDNPDHWPGQWRAAGFTEFAGYLSAENSDPGRVDPRLDEIARRLADREVTVRFLDEERFGQELDGIFRLSLISFQKNFLYSPIDREEFMAMYGAIRPYLVRELTLVAERRGETVGFLFAVPDVLQARGGRKIDRVICKTVAIIPDRDYAGLGRLLLGRVLANACDLGYRRAIHALMHEANRSVNLGHDGVRPMRRYALFAKVLP